MKKLSILLVTDILLLCFTTYPTQIGQKLLQVINKPLYDLYVHILLYGFPIILFFLVCAIYDDYKRKEQLVNDELQKRITAIQIKNLINYENSLSIGDRKSVLMYGRYCGFSEHKITNDLLCLLNNNN